MDNIIVKPIELKDIETVKKFDEAANNDVYGMIIDDFEDGEPQDYAYGIYQDNILVGYCTIGGADVLDYDFIKNPRSLLISDVYVDPDYRNKGYASHLITEVIKNRKNTVYLSPLTYELIDLYKRCGFYCIDEKTGNKCNRSYLMVYQGI